MLVQPVSFREYDSTNYIVVIVDALYVSHLFISFALHVIILL